MPRARVLLADDHDEVRSRLRELLEAEFEVVATVSNGYELLGAAKVLTPDAVVTDIGMPGLDGLKAAEFMLRERPSLPIVVVSIHEDQALVQRTLDIGVMGFVAKSGGCNELVDVVRSALRGIRRVPGK